MNHISRYSSRQVALIAGLALSLGLAALTVFAIWSLRPQNPASAASPPPTQTPIKHLVVIYQEGVSFDHYFGTYPNAANPSDEPQFAAAKNTPRVNGLTPQLLDSNPNAANPFRLKRSQAVTCEQNPGYKGEQKAFDAGKMDKFIESTGNKAADCTSASPVSGSQVMGYYDGNTVTGLWNYAQHFAISDNSYASTFGPSTPGGLNLVAGQTHGVIPSDLSDTTANGTVIGDADPAYDDCASGQRLLMYGQNIGDKLNERNMSWGFFQGGFRPTQTSDAAATCDSSHQNVAGQTVTDYSAQHEPFQYYSSTANPHHLPPSSPQTIGKRDQANHQYDMADFWAAADGGNLPQVSFLKAPRYQDGHAGYSDPMDEQRFLVETLNRLQENPSWGETAVVIAYDGSGGWYDHQRGQIVNASNDSDHDALVGSGNCGNSNPGSYQDRCGYGARQPLLVLSPFARANFVDHTQTDQSSILRFIEDNWYLGHIGDQSYDQKAGSLTEMFDFDDQRGDKLFLDPTTGEIQPSQASQPPVSGPQTQPPR